MIRPQRNAHRDHVDLAGIWRVRFDPEDRGREAGWGAGIGDGLPIAVPGSWNEQLAEAGYMNYVGAAWLETEVFVPAAFAGRRTALRFGSADYDAEVWVDGAYVGRSGAAMLPFEVLAPVRAGAPARVVVRVSNLLPEQGPTQRVTVEDYRAEARIKDEYLPAVRFDFFPYGGLNRTVQLTAAPEGGLTRVAVTPGLDGGAGTLKVVVEAAASEGRVRVSAAGARVTANLEDGRAALTLRADDVEPWSPASPRLYAVVVDLLEVGGAVVDRVDLQTGFRDVRVDGTRLLLNGEPIELRGFGMHEDAPIRGRGLDLPRLVKDFSLLKWTGANSVRTSHYPYAEEFLDFADQEGVLVIGEAFSINLDFRKVQPEGLAAHEQAVAELIERDRHRPCVIAWSVANEPGYLGEAEYRERSGPYWKALFAEARELDDSRPLTHANVTYAGLDDPAFAESDFLSVNRYFGWYTEPGQIDRGVARLKADLDALAAHGKPLFVSEFGADAMAGLHATTDQLFTEDYQADFIDAYWRVIAEHPACIGGHVWNFADFRTAQHARRVVLNLKGVFTRTRDPKRAAFRLRDLWRGAQA